MQGCVDEVDHARGEYVSRARVPHVRLPELHPRQGAELPKVVTTLLDLLEVSVEVERGEHDVTIRVHVLLRVLADISPSSTRQSSSKSRCSVKMIAGSPIRTARSQMRTIEPCEAGSEP